VSDRLNFHEYLLAIQDEFKLNHPQMVELRKKLTSVYHGQFQVRRSSRNSVSLEALGQVVWDGMSNGQSLETMLASDLITQARRIEQAWAKEQAS